MFVWAPEDGVYTDHQCELGEGHDGPHCCCCGDEPPAT